MVKSRRSVWSFVVGLVVLIAATMRTAYAGTEPTKTEDIVACVENAAESFHTCWEEHAWYVRPLCTAKYAADALLCGPMEIVEKLMKDNK